MRTFVRQEIELTLAPRKLQLYERAHVGRGIINIDPMNLKLLRETGSRAIINDGDCDTTVIPLQQSNVVFRQMFEYPVKDFEAEVGFYLDVFGFPAIALTKDYALFKHPETGDCISFRRNEESPTPIINGLKLLFMTTEISTTDTHLEATGFVPNREIRKGSAVQEVIHLSTPAGVTVEIWQMPIDD